MTGGVFPELTASATSVEAAKVKEKGLAADGFDGYYSTSKTCEIAMSDAVGQNYQSLLNLLDDCI